jgi:hypothetical protein
MITNVEEFKQVIEGNYGITDLKSYGDYKMKKGPTGITKEEVELLSPDNINSCSFWEYIEKNPELAKDAIAFGLTKERSIEEVNRNNFCLACSLNVLSYVMMYKDIDNLPILDIGAGYGMLKDFVKQNTKLNYCGVDVYPKIEGICQVGEDGSTLPPNIAASSFGLVIAVNVFQHLSVKQKRHYYEQIEKMLIPTFGIFTVTHMVDIPNSHVRGFKCNDDGKFYGCHYGQYVELQTFEEIKQDLMKHFYIISVSNRGMDNSFTFHCSKKATVEVTPKNAVAVDTTPKP